MGYEMPIGTCMCKFASSVSCSNRKPALNRLEHRPRSNRSVLKVDNDSDVSVSSNLCRSLSDPLTKTTAGSDFIPAIEDLVHSPDDESLTKEGG